MRLFLFCLAAVALAGCVSGLTKNGVLLSVGEQAEKDHAAVLVDREERGDPPPDFLGSLLEIAAYVALGGAGVVGGYKGVGWVAGKTPWTKDEIHDIQNPTTIKPV